MSNIRIKNKTVATSVTESDYLLGTHDNGDGTFTDLRYQLHKLITVSSTNTTLTDAFFSNTITEIAMNGQVYLLGNDFTQSGTTITLTNGAQFISGQNIKAKL